MIRAQCYPGSLHNRAEASYPWLSMGGFPGKSRITDRNRWRATESGAQSRAEPTLDGPFFV